MKTVVGISNFSFECSHFNSFEDLDDQFKSFQPLSKSVELFKVSTSVANDIFSDKSHGLSIDEQIKNFEFGTDLGVITRFKLNCERTYFREFSRSKSTKELINYSNSAPCLKHQKSTILFVPKALIQCQFSFKDEDDFFAHYEYLLGHYPVSNSNFYEKATKYFSNLIYHSDCEKTLDKVNDGFCNYTIAFTNCLKALNESCPIGIKSTSDKLAFIGAKTKYLCTQEGTTNENFKFNFDFNGIAYDKLDCQYHLKPSDKNQAGDGSHNHKRLYFGFIPLENQKWQIAVSVIGPHINKNDKKNRYAPLKDKRKK